MRSPRQRSPCLTAPARPAQGNRSSQPTRSSICRSTVRPRLRQPLRRRAGLSAVCAKLAASPAALAGAAGLATLLVAGGLAAALWPRGGTTDAGEVAQPVQPAASFVAADDSRSNVDTSSGEAGAAAIGSVQPSPNEPVPAVASAPPAHESSATVDPNKAEQVAAAPAFEAAPAVDPAPQTAPPAAIANLEQAKGSARGAGGIAPAAEPAPPAEPAAKANAGRTGVLAIDPLDPLNFDPANLSLLSGPPASSATTSTVPPSTLNSDVANGPAANPSRIDARVDTSVRRTADQEETPTISVRRGPPDSSPAAMRSVADQLKLPIRRA